MLLHFGSLICGDIYCKSPMKLLYLSHGMKLYPMSYITCLKRSHRVSWETEAIVEEEDKNKSIPVARTIVWMKGICMVIP